MRFHIFHLFQLFAILAFTFLKSTIVSDGGTPIFPILSDTPPTPAQRIQSQMYAERYAVSEEEALKRMRLQKLAGELQALLINQYEDEFAGMWVEHEPNYRFVIMLVSKNPEYIHHLYADTLLVDYIEVISASISYQELKNRQHASISILNNASIPSDTGIDIKNSQVNIYLDDEWQHNRHALADLGLPENVYISFVTAIGAGEEADIYGGLDTGSCMTGFSVFHNSGALSTTTAGHCMSTQSYLGQTLNYLAATNSGSADIARLDPATHAPRNFFNVNGSIARVHDIKHRDAQMLGESVCHMTTSTSPASFVCGNIIDRDYGPGTFNPTFIRVSSSGTNLSEDGDSGSSWSSGNEAYGFHKGAVPAAPDDAYYMAQNYASVLGLCILHGVVNTPAPVTNVSFTGSALRLEWALTGHCGYEIHRSQNPYFTTSSGTVAATVTKNNASFTSSVGVGDVNNNYYYNVNVVTGSPSQSSTTFGEFDFAIVPGS